MQYNETVRKNLSSNTTNNLNNLSNWPSITSNEKETEPKRIRNIQSPKEEHKDVPLFSEISSPKAVLSDSNSENQPSVSGEINKSDNVQCQNYVDNRTREQILIDRKIRIKVKRENLKLQKEEKARKLKIAEKSSQHVRLIDQNTLDKILQKTKEKSENVNYFCTERENVVNNHLFKADILEKKPIKKSDPVKIDISQICTVKKKQKKEIIKPKDKTEFYSANILDSSNPVRHRGKKRENGNKKPTKLKKQILRHRELKKFSAEEGVINAESSDILNETREDVVHPASEPSNNQGDVDQICTKLNSIDCNSSNCNKNETGFKIFSRRFREYCDNCITEELKKSVEALLLTLVGFQERQFQRDPIKAKSKKRLIFGFKETTNVLKLNKACMIIIAPDIEKIPQEGGTFDLVDNLKRLSLENGIPYLFSLERRQLGYVTLKKVMVSCIAVLNKEGADDLFNKCVELLHGAREQFAQLRYSSPST